MEVTSDYKLADGQTSFWHRLQAGSAAIAAMRADRDCVGIDLVP